MSKIMPEPLVWSEKQVADFWEHNTSDFSGDKTASVVISLVGKYIKGKVLDVGAGSGALISQLPDAIGVDIVPRHPQILSGTVARLPIEANSVDTVFCTDVLEHLDDEIMHKGLWEITRVMKRGARLIIAVPYNENLSDTMVYCPCCKKSFHRWGHCQTFNVARLNELLTLRGMTIGEVKILPLGLMADYHRFLWQHWKWIVALRIVKKADVLGKLSLMVVAQKL